MRHTAPANPSGILSVPPAGRPLRVLDVTIFYTAASGGVRTYLNAKSTALAQRGIHHALAIPGPRGETASLGHSRVHVLRGPPVPFTPGYRLLISRRQLEAVLEQEAPDLVEMGSPFLLPSLLRRATRGRRIPIVGFYHSDVIRSYALPYAGRLGAGVAHLSGEAARRYIRSVYTALDATVAASRSVAQELEELGVPNVRSVPLGVDLQLFHPARANGEFRRRVGAPPGTPIGLFAGRLCPEKRLDVVLDAQLRLPAGRRPHLVLMGEGQLAQRFLAESRRRPGLTVLPHQPDRGVLASSFAGADFYLAAGPGETFGLAVAEALASGLPVLAVDSGAVPDRVEGSGVGFLYRDGNPEACAEAMARLLARLGPELRVQARRHARNTLGWDRTFDALETLYRELVQGTPPG